MIKSSKSSLIILLASLLASCSPAPAAITPQATELDCKLVLDVFKKIMHRAYSAQGIDKIYQLQIANMNLDILFNRGCCKYADTCPLIIDEQISSPVPSWNINKSNDER